VCCSICSSSLSRNPRRSWCWTSTPATCRCTERRRGGSSTVAQPAPAKAGNHYCSLAFYVFCGERLLACVLRPSNRDGVYQAAAVLKRLLKRLRRAWPGVRIVVRGDSGFCRRRLMNGCKRNTVSYVIGLARNARLHERVALVERALEGECRARSVKQREIGAFAYAAGSWKSQRRVVTRLEYRAEGTNPRFVATNLEEPVQRSTTSATAPAAKPRTGSRKCTGTVRHPRPWPQDGNQSAAAALRGAGLHADRAAARAGADRNRSGARRPPRFACACSGSARPSCATRVVCASSSPRTTPHATPSSPPPALWRRSPRAVLSPARVNACGQPG
jgi:hypothetical protein